MRPDLWVIERFAGRIRAFDLMPGIAAAERQGKQSEPRHNRRHEDWLGRHIVLCLTGLSRCVREYEKLEEERVSWTGLRTL
jgi:hypothetical protein